MQAYRPILKHHRLQRCVLWLLAMLSWVSDVFFANRPITTRHNRQRGDIALTHLARWVGDLIVIRATAILRLTHQRRHLWRQARVKRLSAFRRSLLGAKLRRMLKHKDARTLIAQLINVLRNLDHYAAQLAHNVRHHRRRLARTIPPIAPSALLLGAPAPSPALANSS